MSEKPDPFLIERGIAQGAHSSHPLTSMAKRGLIEFLRQEVLNAEWEIARAKATIEAYETAIQKLEDEIPKSNTNTEPSPR